MKKTPDPLVTPPYGAVSAKRASITLRMRLADSLKCALL
jgi:hypothetical protein